MSKFVLLLDNLKVQIQDDFKESFSNINSPLWYELPDATDDADYAACLKSLFAHEYRKWLGIEKNVEIWFGNEDPLHH